MAKSISIEHLFKVFGKEPDKALALARQGLSKQDIVAQTGASIGVFDASFTIEAGEIFVIMGLSGSGKSTLVRMLNRLIEPTAGRILVDGDDINQYNEQQLRGFRRKDISMVFQSFALLPHLTVLDNTAFGLELAGVDKEVRLRQAREALAQVGLEVWADSYPDELSGGMQQRVGLARALAADPAILLMDEAFSALDPIIRTEMQDELLRLQQEKRRTIVFISHDLDEAMRIGDHIAIMKDGQVVQVGTPEEILLSPADDYVRSFISGVDTSAVFKAGDIARRMPVEVAVSPERGCRPALQRMEDHDHQWAYVVDTRHRTPTCPRWKPLTATTRSRSSTARYCPAPVRCPSWMSKVVTRAASARTRCCASSTPIPISMATRCQKPLKPMSLQTRPRPRPEGAPAHEHHNEPGPLRGGHPRYQ